MATSYELLSSERCHRTATCRKRLLKAVMLMSSTSAEGPASSHINKVIINKFVQNRISGREEKNAALA